MNKYIKILFLNMGNNKYYYIDLETNNLLYNDEVKKITTKDLENLKNFFLSWDEKYISSKIIDGERFYIEINDGNEIIKYEGNGKYPDNYNNFKYFLEELSDRK